MFQLRNLQPRAYQQSIFETARQYNTLAVLETGLGKTAIAIMLALDKLSQDLSKKVLILAPSRPLIAQHYQSFLQHSNLDAQDLAVITGKLSPEQRKKQYQQALVILSTPQCISNDLKKHRISLDNISLIVFDEAHHAIKNYAYVNIALSYLQHPRPHIVALTASPGSSQQKINEIKKNLGIEKVEIRTSQDRDVQPYMQERNTQWLTINLDPTLLNIIAKIKQLHTQKLRNLKQLGISKPINLITKRDLLDLQAKYRQQLSHRNPIAFHAISLTSQLLKTSHLIDMLETQGTSTSLKYLDKLAQETSKAAKGILSNQSVQQAIKELQSLKSYLHPKIVALKKIVDEELSRNPKAKIIIFVNFRDTIDEILHAISNIPPVKPAVLIGQKEGLSQREQVRVIEDFESHKYNVLLATSIGEEGLSIASLDIAIFYDAVPSAIRRIQRTGRVARLKPGKIIHLIAAHTRDEAYFWKSSRDEARMKTLLYQMQGKEQQATL